MRLACLVFGVALTGLLVLPVSDAGAVLAGLIVVALLPLLGYRDGARRLHDRRRQSLAGAGRGSP